ncbi:MAG TPA: BTAD domain-containing putative transcriptional regulator [Streptosporangiaceae bacterium]
MTEFRVLGGFEVRRGDRTCAITAPKLRQLLALLALSAGRLVHLELLIDELWDHRPPKSAVSTVQTYIYQLRKIFAQEGLDEPGSELLVTETAGYVLRLDPEQVDANVFRRLAAHGRAQLDQGRHDEARTVLRRALDLWTGPALAGVPQGRVLRDRIIPLEEQRLHVLELRIRADLQVGLHRELIGELRCLVAAHPLNEWFSEQLICALSRAGRRHEALQAYHNLRCTLNEELGLEPAPTLQRLHQEVLRVGYFPMDDQRGVPQLRAAGS